MLDYYLQRGFTLDFPKVYQWFVLRQFRFVFIFFHSIELILALWAAVLFMHLSVLWIAFMLGLTQHLIVDILTNPVRGYFYFLSYRIYKGFKKENLFIQTQS